MLSVGFRGSLVVGVLGVEDELMSYLWIYVHVHVCTCMYVCHVCIGYIKNNLKKEKKI